MINTYIPYFKKKDQNILNQCLKTNFVSTAGPLVKKFQEKFCKKYSFKYSVAVNSGTSALHLGLKALGVNKGDSVILPSYTFVVSAMAILAAGLKPIFVDIEENTGQLSTSSVERFLGNEKLERNKIVAVMPVSPFGAKIDKEIWSEFSSKHKLEVVYDEAWCFDSFVPSSKGASALSLHATKPFYIPQL